MNNDDKYFLTYNQQMRKLRDDKQIVCKGTPHKMILVRSGYFNIINGYKNPFVSGQDSNGKHHYISGTSIDQMQAVKKFDESLRSFLLKYITQVEEEVRALSSYKFDECNDNGNIPWYSTEAYSPNKSLQDKMNVISKAYSELSRSRLDYVNFYMQNHKQIPTWIMFKVVNFSTFIDLLSCGRMEISHSLCTLYHLLDNAGLPDVKLLIGSLHWMRKTRNSCAHNERVYCLSENHRSSGRIVEPYLQNLGARYTREPEKKLFDLFVYFKYYLPNKEYRQFINELKTMLSNLKNRIHPHAFEYVRGKIGIHKLEDLEALLSLPKDDIEYNKFDKHKK